MPGWLIFGTVVLLVGGTLAQYFHGTLHRPDNPRIVHAMRRAGLLMTPEAHALHHATLAAISPPIPAGRTRWCNIVFQLATRRGWLTEAGLEPR